ncbi:hypothetical protein GCM10009530_59890 [Microbispora corallina]|uniref:Tyr recombinase domain-containing protein n=1 Tax=Microbispora corallina TaxID=83302 RepID=A0ABQ4GA21_9ACTN|nr:hypothetical protein Mco01_69360 [Microbispora corallina]
MRKERSSPDLLFEAVGADVEGLGVEERALQVGAIVVREEVGQALALLEHRADRETREIPIPPILVAVLREHIKAYSVAKDGRLFRTATGGSYSSSAYSYVWQEARKLALTPAQVASSLAARPYDLRHAAVSLWLNAGVAAPEVAKRAGHSVDVLLRVYAKCIDGQQDHVNGKINDALGCCTGADRALGAFHGDDSAHSG